MGVGMIAVVPQESVEAALTTLADRGVDAWVSGEIVERGDHAEAVTLTGDYAS